MIIGIDVGGTHADGVLLEGADIVKKNKVNVNQTNLQDGILTLLESLIPEQKERLSEVHLSTTLCTNAVVNEDFEKVGMFIQAGPGVNPDFFSCGDHFYLLDGIIDHRGQALQQPSKNLLKSWTKELRDQNICSIAIATKFSHRNNSHEILIRDQLNSDFRFISLGHQLSGVPNFPRRVYTSWLNSALMSTFTDFKVSMDKSFKEMGIDCPCYILKADGGTIPFERGCDFPSQSIHSGPSASVMGALALYEDIGDALLLDIGGTTTDIAIFADGTPLLEPYGATVSNRPTLVRALQSKSIGIGGDSCVRFHNNTFVIGPDKKGQPMALGGEVPTPTDAMIVLGTVNTGSKEKAAAAMQLLCPLLDPTETASQLLHTFVVSIQNAAAEMVEEIFSRPVYTVSELLTHEKIQPKQLIAIGGPAKALQAILSECFAMNCIVPKDYEVANAIGAARARITVQASLYADSNVGSISIPEVSCFEAIPSSFTMMAAEARLAQEISLMAQQMGMQDSPEIDIIEREVMNTVRGFSTTGKIISLKGQIRPGLRTFEEEI